MAKYIREFPESYFAGEILTSSCRIATEEELRDARNYNARLCELERRVKTSHGKDVDARRELTKLRAACRHEICEETEGFLYNTRRCVACGAGMGAL